MRALVCPVTFVHLERGTATSEHKIRNNRRWFSSFKFLRILHKHNWPILLQPKSWAASKCYSVARILGISWYLVLWKTQMLVLFGKSHCCTSCVMVIPIQVDWLACTSAAGFATHEQTEDNERWGGWTQTKFLAKLHLKNWFHFNMHNAPCKSMDHRCYWMAP